MNSKNNRFSALFKGSVFFVMMMTSPVIGRAGTEWSVSATMDLPQIQAVIDGALDGDIVVFEKGIYDFSGAPFSPSDAYIGALNIIDKSLALVAKKGVVIKGASSVLDPLLGYGTLGITAFTVKNTDRTKDVTIEGFNFETLLQGVSVFGARNIILRNCILTAIDRNGVGIAGPSGNVDLQANQIATRRLGIFVSWYWWPLPGTNYQSPGTKLQIAENEITQIGTSSGFGGVAVQSCREAQVVQNSVASPSGGNFGILLENTAPLDSPLTPQCFISGNAIRGPLRGIIIGNNSYPTPRAYGVQVDNNTLHGSIWGVYLNNSTYCGVFTNRIVLADTMIPVGTGTELDGSLFGILLAGNSCAQNHVIGNRISLYGLLAWTAEAHTFGIASQGHNDLFSGNVVSGQGSGAFWVGGNGYSMGHDEVFECNIAKRFTPAPDAAHYIFDSGSFNSRFSESWGRGVSCINLGDASNTVTTIVCN